MESKKAKQNSFVWEQNVARPQGSGDSWAADKPVGGVEGHPHQDKSSWGVK